MDLEAIKIEYRDTPEKLREAADEVIAYLVKNLLILNAIEEECAQLAEYQKRGIRIKGKPKDSEGIWSLFRTRYGEAASVFCADKLLARGYAQSMSGPHRVMASDGTLLEEKIYGEYSYLAYGCELTITMKSPKRAVIEVFYVEKDFDLDTWCQFTLTNTDGWLLADKKTKRDENDKWRSVNL